jgi:3-methyladenine DNA glycosylase AlkD
MWLNRAAIIFQLTYKNKTDLKCLESAILPHLKSKEFFHQKAIGWALRQLAKSNPDWVLTFCRKNELKSLSKREALKHLKSWSEIRE